MLAFSVGTPLSSRHSFIPPLCVTRPIVIHNLPSSIYITPLAHLRTPSRAPPSSSSLRETVDAIERSLHPPPRPQHPPFSYRHLHETILACTSARRWSLSLRVYHALEQMYYSASRSTSSLVLNTLTRCGRITEAETLLTTLWDPHLTLPHSNYPLDDISISRRRPDEKMVTTVCNVAVDHGCPDVAVRMMRLMELNAVSHTVFSISVLLKAHGRQGEPAAVASVLSSLTQRGVVPDVVVFNSAIDALVRCGDRIAALRVLREISRRDLTPSARSYNPIIKEMARLGKVADAFAMRDHMVRSGIPPSLYTVNALITACVNASDWLRARQLLEAAVNAAADAPGRDTLPKDIVVGFTTIISGLARAGHMSAALEMLEELNTRVSRAGRGLDGEVGIAATAIISALLDGGETTRGLELFRSVQKRFGITLRPDVYNAVVRGLAKHGDQSSVEAAQDVLDEMVSIFRKNEKDVVMAYNALIDGIVRRGDMTTAEEVLNTMEDGGFVPNIVTYTTLISGYGRELDVISARHVFKRMRSRGLRPDRVTMNAFLGACARGGDVSMMVRIFEEMQRMGGRVSPNLVSFSAIIAAFVRKGRREEAWEMYEEMKGVGIAPNERLLDRMMAAFVTPEIRPKRGELYNDIERVIGDGERERIVVTEIEEDGVVIDVEEDVIPRGLDNNSNDEEDCDDNGRLLEELQERLEDGGGWVSKRAQTLLEDMEACKCSEINKRRWKEAIASLLS